MADSLEERIAARALSYVTDSPAGLDPVIELAAPDDLRLFFDRAVPLGFEGEADSHDDDSILAAVDLVIKHSVHTSHPRFVNQNFAGPDPVSVVGDWLGAALNTTGATFEAAPVFTLMESAVLSKLGRVAGYLDSSAEQIPALPPASSALADRPRRSMHCSLLATDCSPTYVAPEPPANNSPSSCQTPATMPHPSRRR